MVFDMVQPRMAAMWHTAVVDRYIEDFFESLRTTYSGPATLCQDLTVFQRHARSHHRPSGITAMVPQYLPEETITCGDDITTHDAWSAHLWALDNEGLNIHLIGLTVQQHSDDKIHRQHVNVTQLTGKTAWGTYSWGANAAGRPTE